MAEQLGKRSATTVFVSYAHESDAFREQVKQLCDWLRGQGVAVVCDFDNYPVPPLTGLDIWMQHGIEDARVVLVIASPLYKDRFEKRAEPTSGKGVAWEGAIMTHALYQAAQRNNKFFPILPDGGSPDHIPVVLQAFDVGHRFPSKQEGVLALILGCGVVKKQLDPLNDSDTSIIGASSGISLVPNHRDKALRELTLRVTSALDKPQASPFRKALALKLALSGDVDVGSLIKALDALQPLNKQLLKIEGAIADKDSRFSGVDHPIEVAASWLFLRAAIAAVNLTDVREIEQPTDGLMVVPQKSDVVIAILVAALRGEVRRIRLDTHKQDTATEARQALRSDGLIDLDSLPFDPLRTHESIEKEAALQLDKLGAVLYRGNWTVDRPSDPEALKGWRERIRDAADRSREIDDKPFRFVVTRGSSELLNDDAECEAIYVKLGIPFTRVEPNALQPQEVELLLGISVKSIENRFGDFLVSLGNARQPEATIKDQTSVADLISAMLMLFKENQANKDELSKLTLKLETSKSEPKRETIQEVLDTVDKGRKLGEAADKYAEFCRKAYSLGQLILDNLPL